MVGLPEVNRRKLLSSGRRLKPAVRYCFAITIFPRTGRISTGSLTTRFVIPFKMVIERCNLLFSAALFQCSGQCRAECDTKEGRMLGGQLRGFA